MERSISEIGQGVDVNFWVVDESANDGDGWIHGCEMQGCPSRLKLVVDVDGSVGAFSFQHVDEGHGLIFDDGL